MIRGFIITACLLLLTGKAVNVSDGKKLNVLFLVVDDLRPALGCYDYETPTFMRTPNIDNLAAKSVLFENAFTQQAFCGPSRTSFLTSRRPDTTRLYDLYSYWRVHAGNYTTLPQHFKEHGYITQSVGKVFHPNRASNYSDDSPYSWTNTPYHAPTMKDKQWEVCPTPDGGFATNVVCPVEMDKMPGKSLPDIQIADFSVDFLKNSSHTNVDKPFFLGVGFHKPHLPLKYPKEYLKLYPLSEVKVAKHHTYPLRLPLVAWNPWTDIRMREDVMKLNVSFPFGPVPEYFQRLMRQSYYAATSYMDTQVGRVLSALEEAGLAENTIVSLIGDHGWSLGEHQEWSKYSLLSPAVKVPLMVYVPGVTNSRHDKHNPTFPFFDPFKPKHVVDKSDDRKNFNVVSDKHDSRSFEKQSVWNNMSKIGDGSPNIKSLVYKKTDSLVELVDMFPTLSDAAGLPKLPLCPVDPFKVLLCTEGTSLMPLIRNVVREESLNRLFNESRKIHNGKFKTAHFDNIYTHAKECSPNFTIPVVESFQWKKAAFSQFPRPSVEPQENSDKPHLHDIKIMGYSMWTPDFHYTEWVGFTPKNYRIHWDRVFGRELYIVQSDPYEIHNQALFSRCAALVSELSRRLRQGWRDALPDGIIV